MSFDVEQSLDIDRPIDVTRKHITQRSINLNIEVLRIHILYKPHFLQFFDLSKMTNQGSLQQ